MYSIVDGTAHIAEGKAPLNIHVFFLLCRFCLNLGGWGSRVRLKQVSVRGGARPRSGDVMRDGGQVRRG